MIENGESRQAGEQRTESGTALHCTAQLSRNRKVESGGQARGYVAGPVTSGGGFDLLASKHAESSTRHHLHFNHSLFSLARVVHTE